MKNISLLYWEFKDDLDIWWRSADSDVRNKIIDHLNNIPMPQHTVDKADCRFAVNYSNRIYELGDSCVYARISYL